MVFKFNTVASIAANVIMSPFKHCFNDLIIFKLFKNQYSGNLYTQKKSRKVGLYSDEHTLMSCSKKMLTVLNVFWNVNYSVVTKTDFFQSLLILGIGFVHFYNVFAPSYGQFRICFIGSDLFKGVQRFHLVNLNFY